MIFHQNAKRDRFVETHPQLVPCRAGSGPRHLALHPKPNVLYRVNELAGTLAGFAIRNETGALRAVQHEMTTPEGFTGNARAADLPVTPDRPLRQAAAVGVDRVHRLDVVAGS